MSLVGHGPVQACHGGCADAIAGKPAPTGAGPTSWQYRFCMRCKRLYHAGGATGVGAGLPAMAIMPTTVQWQADVSH